MTNKPAKFPAKTEKGQIYKAIIVRGDDVRLTAEQADVISNYMLAHKPGQVVRIKEQDITLRIGDVRRVERDFAAEKELHREKVQAVQQQLIKAKEDAKRSACHGQYSIQRAINEIAFNDHPKDWRKYVANKAWREETRQQLRKNTQEWCDHREGTCYCEGTTSPLGGKRPYPAAFVQAVAP